MNSNKILKAFTALAFAGVLVSFYTYYTTQSLVAFPYIVGVLAPFGTVLLAVVLLLSLVARKPKWALINLVMMALMLGNYLVLPYYQARTANSRAGASSAQHGELAVVSINVEFGAGHPDQIAKQVKDHRADVLVVTEATQAHAQQLLPLIEAELPFHTELPRSDSGYETTIYARYPLLDTGLLNQYWGPYSGSFQIPFATLEHPQGKVRVMGVHVLPPMRARTVSLWQRDLMQIGQWAEKSPEVPALAAGDYNAAYVHRPYRQMLGSGHDALDQEGIWPRYTWPHKFPFTRIDHINLWGAQASEAGTFEVEGTDHLGVWAKIRF
ncbi:hypothetical protein BSR29_03890 [Boudabousia liubingyangii]|uniref:Endonuclease/exonuclease/phosphatase domain-containing protein n=1 Tax=Boudabousia liubingyangii TaxID=1921764 RepID=A0A1Q5PN53_9ACTO|nr:endonuclease/exonuclease/phosphatase family protein [Boudabousia liubingyangii]OKL48988.1 hypothetical protein BSR29_03890 [Boudabousia liubingyangii]